jgi:hypothetical protein
MEGKGCVPDADTYMRLIPIVVRHRRVDLAVDYVKSMCSAGTGLVPELKYSIIFLFCRLSRSFGHLGIHCLLSCVHALLYSRSWDTDPFRTTATAIYV